MGPEHGQGVHQRVLEAILSHHLEQRQLREAKLRPPELRRQGSQLDDGGRHGLFDRRERIR